MPPTRKKIANNEQMCKQKTRKHISIEQKLNILKEIDKGTTLRKVARLFHLPKSSVDSIKANREKISECGRHLSSEVAGTTMRTRNSRIHVTETLLHTWIVEQREKGATLSENLMRSKALAIFQDVKVEKQIECNFYASHGWFEQYKKRFKLMNVFLTGESAITDKDAALQFVEKFKCIVSEGGYCPQQVFNCDETELNWKKSPTRSYVTDNEKGTPGFKTNKDKITLLLGCNASGDAKLKPLLLHRAQNPRSLKNVDEDALPVIWRNNSKAWVTENSFNEWFTWYFVPFIEKYNAEHGLENKALLLLANAPEHPVDLNVNHPHINVVFTPPNTTAVLQPMDQGIISIFKAHYLREVMRRIVNTTTTSEDDVTIFWNNFKIKHALETIEKAWDSITTKALNVVWRAIWPECVTAKRSDARDIMEKCTKDIQDLTVKAGLESITVENMEELLNEDEEKLMIIQH